jgi:AcrR family transcriptional regulator
MAPAPHSQKDQWPVLSRNDWGDILELAKKKAYQRKFQIIDVFVEIAANEGFHRVTHREIANVCRISRSLVLHHFPSEEHLIGLTYRYVYARFQKSAADAISTRKGALNQLRAYAESVARWTFERRADARFLSQFLALLQSRPQYLKLHARNLQIGRERIAALYRAGVTEGELPRLDDTEIAKRAFSLQLQLFGFLSVCSGGEDRELNDETRDEVVRSCLRILTGP